ncbi:hypothetical protein [Paenibacillus roseipurpureus]|uniref:Uncharacterized protein n=1 Tax=Paenibacillus roseopurpureus TaxID=2918901 RepID=A0AA96RMG7_9BACL|nr:hypothetical protein [Paenibacillus sp. MBLB1832]WNR46414.1 hypothetical protein MJB10_10070 [Paenibacillus sp. MBLB1832]
MTRYWFTPILGYAPLRLGAERFCVPASEELDAFRSAASQQHPRLLTLFKASLLLSDDEDLCGSDLVELDLTQSGDVVFDGSPLHLSHCAEAFMDRLLPVKEAVGLVKQLEASATADRSSHLAWIKLWLGWLEAGYDVVLLREDG